MITENNVTFRKWMFFLLYLCLCMGLTGCRDRAEEFLQEVTADEPEQVEDSNDGLEQANNSQDQTEPAETGQEAVPEITEAVQKTEIYVDVCGAVAVPGVYVLDEDSRVFQAIEAAGGFLPEAASACVNQAQGLTDGQQIYIPTQEEASEGDFSIASSGTDQKQSTDTAQSTDDKVDLNTADADALCTLSGIGQAKAAAIISYRETNGAFSSIEEIMNVEGIKEGTFSKIKDKIVVR
jgi:competence protein ComEA